MGSRQRSEARLRQARIEQLRGNTRRAATAFDGLAAGPVVDWIGVVAVQERARQLLADGELAAAVALLASDAGGFIKLNALRMRIAAKVRKGK